MELANHTSHSPINKSHHLSSPSKLVLWEIADTLLLRPSLSLSLSLSLPSYYHSSFRFHLLIERSTLGVFQDDQQSPLQVDVDVDRNDTFSLTSHQEVVYYNDKSNKHMYIQCSHPQHKLRFISMHIDHRLVPNWLILYSNHCLLIPTP